MLGLLNKFGKLLNLGFLQSTLMIYQKALIIYIIPKIEYLLIQMFKLIPVKLVLKDQLLLIVMLLMLVVAK